MEQNKTVIFEQFARKAKERIEERKKYKKEELILDSLGGVTMEIRGLSDTELNEVYEFSNDPIENDKYAIYFASSTLQETAKFMVGNGSLQTGKEYHITDMFTNVERRFIADRILVLSGVNGEPGIRIKETEEVKKLLKQSQIMWLTGYWMEYGGFKPEEILALSPNERTVWQAIAELNREQRYRDMKNAMAEAVALVISQIRK